MPMRIEDQRPQGKLKLPLHIHTLLHFYSVFPRAMAETITSTFMGEHDLWHTLTGSGPDKELHTFIIHRYYPKNGKLHLSRIGTIHPEDNSFAAQTARSLFVEIAKANNGVLPLYKDLNNLQLSYAQLDRMRKICSPF